MRKNGDGERENNKPILKLQLIINSPLCISIYIFLKVIKKIYIESKRI